MHAAPTARSFLPLAPLLTRAIVMYLVIKASIIVIALLARAAGFMEPGHGVGLVALTAILGGVDILRRGESMLWANLGFSRATLAVPFVIISVMGEVLWAVT